MEKKTVLFIRSSPTYHCWPLFNQLRESRHPDSSTRWVCVVQPHLEREFRDLCRIVEADVLIYSDGPFTFDGLKKSLGQKIGHGTVDVAYVPLNHLRGKGYFPIIRFLSSSGIPRIVLHSQDDRFEEITLARFIRRRFMDRIRTSTTEIVDTIVLAMVVPVISLYYVCLFMMIGRRRRPN